MTAVDEACKEGRNSNTLINYFKTLSLLFSSSHIPLTCKPDEKCVKKVIEKISEELETPFQESSFAVEGANLILQNGKSGKQIDRDEFKLKIQNALKDRRDAISIELKNLHPKPFNVEEIYRQVARPAVEAKCELKNDGNYLIKQQDGIDFDKEKAAAIIEENRNNDKPYIIPLTILKPNSYSTGLEQNLFNDTLSSVASRITSQDENRMNNLRLAASKINGIILNPNEVFSYNAYLGEVSYENGFRDAMIYSDGKPIRGIGGGVCQISSVLYSAALRANLEIIRRSNHTFTVDYLPLGEDAAFAGNEKDMRFRNSTLNPIKIQASVDENGAYATIYGTNPDKDLVVSIESIVRNPIPFKTIQGFDASVPSDKILVTQKGKSGYEIDTYRVLSKNGRIIKRQYMYKSRYSPLDQLEYISDEQPAPQDSNSN
jgi:vancomycin resistance protein YoaR